MGPVVSRVVARLAERERRELAVFGEHHTTGSLTPGLQSDEEEEGNAHIMSLRPGMDDHIGPPSLARREQPGEEPAAQAVIDLLAGFAERHTTGSVIPGLQSDEEEEEEGEEVDGRYAVDQNVDPMFFRFPDGLGTSGGRLNFPLQHTSNNNEASSAESSGDDEGNANGLWLRPDPDDQIGLPSLARREQPGDAPAVQEVMTDPPRGRASLVLYNDSTYIVSYSVIRADSGSRKRGNNNTSVGDFKNNTAKLLTRVAGRKTAVGRLLASMETEEEVEKDTTRDMEDDGDMGNFLMRHHRMAPMSENLPTEVLFPADCEELRVRAYARSTHSFGPSRGEEWFQYMNKVYSIVGQRNRAKKKVFTIVASDSAISGWMKQKSRDEVEFRQLSLGRRYGIGDDSDDSSDDSSDGCAEMQAPLSCGHPMPWSTDPLPWSPGSNSLRGYWSES